MLRNEYGNGLVEDSFPPLPEEPRGIPEGRGAALVTELLSPTLFCSLIQCSCSVSQRGDPCYSLSPGPILSTALLAAGWAEGADPPPRPPTGSLVTFLFLPI